MAFCILAVEQRPETRNPTNKQYLRRWKVQRRKHKQRKMARNGEWDPRGPTVPSIVPSVSQKGTLCRTGRRSEILDQSACVHPHAGLKLQGPERAPPALGFRIFKHSAIWSNSTAGS